MALGCALFSNLYRFNAVLVEFDELSSGVPSVLKSDNVKWVSQSKVNKTAPDSSTHNPAHTYNKGLFTY